MDDVTILETIGRVGAVVGSPVVIFYFGWRIIDRITLNHKLKNSNGKSILVSPKDVVLKELLVQQEKIMDGISQIKEKTKNDHDQQEECFLRLERQLIENLAEIKGYLKVIADAARFRN